MPQGRSYIQSSLNSNIILRMSSSTVSIVAIAGITGKLGQLIAKAVLGYPQANIRGFCRDQSKLSPDLSSDPRVTILQGSGDDPAAARKTVQGSDVVICAYLGPNDFMVQSQKILIDAAEAEKSLATSPRTGRWITRSSSSAIFRRKTPWLRSKPIWRRRRISRLCISWTARSCSWSRWRFSRIRWGTGAVGMRSGISLPMRLAPSIPPLLPWTQAL